MKKILAMISVLSVMLSFAACSSSKKDPKTTVVPYESDAVTQSPIAEKQNQKVAEKFGVSIENKIIVGCIGENEYVKYIVTEYDEATGNYRKGQEHYLFHSESAYKAALLKYGDSYAEKDDDAWYLVVASGFAGTNYSADFEKLDKDYDIKTQTGVQ